MPDSQYPHTCPRCKFKGLVQVNGMAWDAYRCGGSLLFRWGPEAFEYFCAPVEQYPARGTTNESHVRTMHLMFINEAHKQAKARGWV